MSKSLPYKDCGVTYAGVQFGVVDESLTDLINRLEVVECDEKKLEIRSFEFITEIGEERILLSNDAGTIGMPIRKVIESLRAGDRFVFYDVMAIDPDGRIYELGPVSIQLVKIGVDKG